MYRYMDYLLGILVIIAVVICTFRLAACTEKVHILNAREQKDKL